MPLDELFPAKQAEALRSDKVADGSDELRFDKVADDVV
jgi:hypothetical protein